MNQIIKRINQALIVQINDKWWTHNTHVQIQNVFFLGETENGIFTLYIVPCYSQFAYNIFCVYIAAFFPQLLFISICAVKIGIVSSVFKSQWNSVSEMQLFFGERTVCGRIQVFLRFYWPIFLLQQFSGDFEIQPSHIDSIVLLTQKFSFQNEH